MSHLQHELVIRLGGPHSAHHDDALWSDLVVVYWPRWRPCQEVPANPAFQVRKRCCGLGSVSLWRSTPGKNSALGI